MARRAQADPLVAVRSSKATLEGVLELPASPLGVVLFAHGTGSSRRSPRNLFVARKLREARLGTLLIDLLTPAEDAVHETRFDIALLSERLADAARFLAREARTAKLPLGLFGASTGGRPDLAGDAALRRVQAATLFIVGGHDYGVIELNEKALAQLPCVKELAIVPGATHLFEERGALDEVARLAAGWFGRHLGG